MGFTFNNNKRQRIIKGKLREKLLTSINWNTIRHQDQETKLLNKPISPRRPTDENKIPDLLYFLVTNGIFSTYTDTQPSYDLTSDHSPITATLSTSLIVRKSTQRLHSSKTNWDTYRQII
jgi:hypothetical protein